MRSENLVILCDNYPNSAGEFFIDDELRIINSKFDKIIVLTGSEKETGLNRFVPDNLKTESFNAGTGFFEKLNALPFVFTGFFLNEIRWAVKTKKAKLSWILLKVVFMDMVRANEVKKKLRSLIKENSLKADNTIFYSYWHDYKALALASLHKEKVIRHAVARAHRWDVYFDVNKFPFLPFKRFIIENLDITIPVSNDAKEELLKLSPENDKKILVSRLGKINSFEPRFEKPDNSFLICSCSNIIPVKRIPLIIESLSKIKSRNVTWIHFGDGNLRKQTEMLAGEKLKNIQLEFKGIVSNEEIMEFYRNHFVDLFINLSESEGIPVSIMEALSAGIPIIATNVGGTSEAVDNKNGFVVDREINSEKVSEIIEMYINFDVSVQGEYRKNAYDSWKEKYNGEKNYLLFFDLLSNLK
ncbi:MAG: hypothetical protein A2W91_12210 [Bacteroidetes bacterium GWF2_38_335]|nr:MAG: hypothetical protein A2W91_12210 [Bacteroidetes bacterium GWF2_38_335]OFY76934.1 MAG: hypothetical protein A2281_00325 [Bacteroidetes bacterium RIFOXYA12_FULL_38_20]HBS86786.1 hypothetical protein [Bacteroidales bacterium]